MNNLNWSMQSDKIVPNGMVQIFFNQKVCDIEVKTLFG